MDEKDIERPLIRCPKCEFTTTAYYYGWLGNRCPRCFNDWLAKNVPMMDVVKDEVN